MMATSPNLLTTWLPLPAVVTLLLTGAPMLWWVSNQARDIEEARAEAAAATAAARDASVSAAAAKADAKDAQHKASLEAEAIRGKLAEIAAAQARQEAQLTVIHQILMRKGAP